MEKWVNTEYRICREKVYGDFLKELHDRGLIRWGHYAKPRLGMFFVKKKNGKLRLIFDTRVEF